MKLPSLRYLVAGAIESFRRFPLVILSSLAAAIVSIVLIGESDDEIFEKMRAVNLILVTALGIPAYFCAAVISEKYALSGKVTYSLNLLITILLALLYYSLPDVMNTLVRTQSYLQFVFWWFAVHLAVSFVPFFSAKGYNGFWQYNRMLFLRFLSSAVYSYFLIIGLFLALFALDKLFDVKFDYKIYPQIAIFFAVFFNTWYFTGGIPKNFERLEGEVAYPNGLRVFCQYVLLPLLGLYLVILYSYGSKIMISGDWPRGIVSYLIIWVSVLGVFLFLLLFPYGNQSGYGWMKKLSRGYYFSLIPLLSLLFIAILMRIDDYGMTVNRYIILMVGLWLLIVCIYTLTGNVNIKFIPVSLTALVLIISFGPWGVFAVSERYQANRLRVIFQSSGILKDGKIVNFVLPIVDTAAKRFIFPSSPNDRKINDSVRLEVESILRYLDTHHGFSALADWFPVRADSLFSSGITHVRNEDLDEVGFYMGLAGISDTFSGAKPAEDISFEAAADHRVAGVSGFDYSINFTRYGITGDESLGSFEMSEHKARLEFIQRPDPGFQWLINKDTIWVPLSDYCKTLEGKYPYGKRKEIPLMDMTVDGESRKWKVKCRFSTLSFDSGNTQPEIKGFSGYWLFKKKSIGEN